MRTGTPFLIAENDRGCTGLTKGKLQASFDDTPEGEELMRRYVEALAHLCPSHLKIQERTSGDGQKRRVLYLYIEDKTNKMHNI